MFVYVFCIFFFKEITLISGAGHFCLSTVGVWSKKDQIRLGDHRNQRITIVRTPGMNTLFEEFLHFRLKLAETFIK